MPTTITYAQVHQALGQTAYLLLGNGFSIGCDPIFSYASLYETAVSAGLSPRAQTIFRRVGTNNFEGVLSVLESAVWVGNLYDMAKDSQEKIRADIEIVKATLVEAVANSHLDHSGMVSDAKKASALAFLKPFSAVFTTNYDLLLYWVNMSDPRPPFQDGFRSSEEEPEAEYLVFSERLGDKPALYYLHGALHFYIKGGELRKHSWIRSGLRLTDLIRDGLASNDYPLFIAEGLPEKKLEQIQRHGYLWYCLEKLSRIASPLVIYGHSLGATDQHLLNALTHNSKLEKLYVGLQGDPDSPNNLAIERMAAQMIAEREHIAATHRGVKQLSIDFFQAESADVWNDS